VQDDSIIQIKRKFKYEVAAQILFMFNFLPERLLRQYRLAEVLTDYALLQIANMVKIWFLSIMN
jgi:hypothetical protein